MSGTDMSRCLVSLQGNRIWSLRLLKAGGASWRSRAINSDRGCRNVEEPASVRSFARSKGSSASNHLPNFSYAIALLHPANAIDTVRRHPGERHSGADRPLDYRNRKLRLGRERDILGH